MPIPRPHLAKLLIVVLGFLGLAAAACRSEKAAAPAAGSPPRAIVLVTIDGLVPGRLALFGGAESAPELERLAAEGAAWEAWTAAPMTRPSAATYLTGLAPDRHVVRDDRFSTLDPSVATLAEALVAAGYRTAAFPDSGFLGSSSGLLRGFEMVSEPRPQPVGPMGWLPVVRPLPDVMTDVEAWIGSLPKESRWFAWIHFSRPLLDQLDGLSGEPAEGEKKEDAAESPLARLDGALADLRRTLRERGDEEAGLVLVAGTQGSIRGGDGGAAGPGYSVAEHALRVPIVAHWPGLRGSWDRDRVAWSPDVPATIASAAGIALAPSAEGQTLTAAAPSDRICFAWAFAALDQMGWRAERAARTGPAKRVEGQTTLTLPLDEAEPVSPAVEARLAEALAQRAVPAAPSVPLDAVRPLLEKHSLKLRPVPAEGRDFADEAKRFEVSELVLRARRAASRGAADDALSAYDSALRLDGDNPGVLLDLSQLVPAPRALKLRSHAVSRYPSQPELLHWYAHAVWVDSWREAEALLEVIEPYKSSEADVLYDLACTRSLGEDLDASEDYLKRAIGAGFRDFAHMESDPDLRNLRASGRFAAVVRPHR